MNLMTRVLSRGIACAVLAAGCLIASAPRALSQAGTLAPVADGHGVFVAQNQETHVFAFSLLELPNGTIHGQAVVLEPATQGLVVVDITSFMFIGDILAMAGPITTAINAPPQFVEGATAFFSVKDNGSGSPIPDEFAGVGVVPPQFGNLTIQQIIALIGPPPPEAFSPLLLGNVRIY
jgi:hypothetical protein